MATLLPNGEQTFLDANGTPLVGGKVYFYIPNTTTPKDTWSDPNQTTLNSNPVVLDSAGRAIIYGSGAYRQVVRDSLGNLIYDQLTADTSSSQISWAGTSTGSANTQAVTASNFTYQDGQQISFIAGYSNTGPMTLNANGVGAIAVVQDGPNGPLALTGGEVVQGAVIQVLYDSSINSFHIIGGTSPAILQSIIAGDEGVFYAAQYGFSTLNTSAQNTTILNSVIATAAAASPPGGKVILPRGLFKLSALTTISNANNLVLQGAGKFSGGTTLEFDNLTGNSISFYNCQYGGVVDCYITSSVRKTADFAIRLDSCYRADIDVRIDYHYNGIEVFNGSEPDITVEYRYMFGTNGTYIHGSNGSGVFGANILTKADNPYLISPGAAKTFPISTAVSLNDVIWCDVTGIIYQVTTAGTLGTFQPSLIGGTTVAEAFTTPITSGSAQLVFVARRMVWTVVDSYSYSIRFLRGSYALNGYEGLLVQDTASTGTSYPRWIYLNELETDHTLWHGVEGYRGESLYVESSWLGSSLLGRGLMIDVNFNGDISIGEASRISGNALEGIYIGSGSKNVRINGPTLSDNGQASTTYNNILFDGTKDFVITNTKAYGTKTPSGIAIAASCDNFIVKDNNLFGNASTGLNNAAGTGATKIVADNLF